MCAADGGAGASVVINNGYDAATRRLDVTVSGALCKVDYSTLMLTVLVKESGMIDYQKDYYKTFEGWSEFRHTNAVRAFLTRADGDTVKVDDTRHYTATYSLTLGNGWKAENCMVVAFLSEGFSPVVQVDEKPVVSDNKQWLIADGTLTVAADGTWVLDAHTLNGSSLRLKGVKAIQY